LKPPPLADWLLAHLAPRRIRDAVLGDLHEEYVRFAVAERGSTRARLWYWTQVIAVVALYRSPHRAPSLWMSRRFLGRRRSPAPRSLGPVLLGSAVVSMAVLVLAVDAGACAWPLYAVKEFGSGLLSIKQSEELVDSTIRVPAVSVDEVATSVRVPASVLDELRARTQAERTWLGWQ
jgi:hypothetical protein